MKLHVGGRGGRASHSRSEFAMFLSFFVVGVYSAIYESCKGAELFSLVVNNREMVATGAGGMGG